MNRHLIWIIAGTSVLGLGVPAFAAARSNGTPDDNGVPGEVRGNCDEAEHANDPNCLALVVPGSTPRPIVVTVPSTTPDIAESNSVARDTVVNPVPDSSASATSGANGNRMAGNAAPAGSDDGVDHDLADDNSAPAGSDDGINHDVADDNSGRGGSDDGINHDLADDNSAPAGSDDGVDHDVADDNSGRGGSDDVDSSGNDHSSDEEHSNPGHGGGGE